jgi:pilus assembly protein CpaC
MMLRQTFGLSAIVLILCGRAAYCAEPAVPAVAASAKPATPAPQKAGPQQIATGGQGWIALDAPATRIALGDPAIVDVKLVSNTRVRLLGLKKGNTDLKVWSRLHPEGTSYDIVVGADVAPLQNSLDKTPALQSVTAVSTAAGVTLQGETASLDDRQQAGALAKAEVGEANNQIAVTGPRMIAVEVRFAAVSTSTMKALGINLQKLGGGFQFSTNAPSSLNSFQFTPPADLSVNGSLPLSQAFNLLLAWPGSNFLGAISALSSVNLAQVLAEPTLLVRSGDEANFLAGGEIPIPVPQSGQSNGAIGIQYRKFGVQLHVQATALSDSRIVIRVNPEVSELDYQNALTLEGFNVPAIRSRSTETTVELGDGQSFVLAGLMYSTATHVEEKVPGLGSLPIVGDFFKRSQNSGEQQELIIVATPHLVSPMAPGTTPKLPGETLAYAPSLTDTLLNTKQLDDFSVQYGLAQP